MEIQSLLDYTYTGFQEALKEQEQLPESLHLLGAFRHRYENSHSDILSLLLDPKSRKSYNPEFLKCFLKTIDPPFLSLEDKDEITIKREYSFKEGRMDILIQIGKKYIIIENKLDYGDGKEQLALYYRFLKDTLPIENIYMLYLTLDGKEPTPQSIGADSEYNKEYKDILELKEKGRFKCISYQKEIYEWLNKIYELVIEEIGKLSIKDSRDERPYRLFSAIDQYLYNIEKLTGQTKEDNLMNKAILAQMKAWEEKNKSSDKELITFYQSVKDSLPSLIFYHELKEIEGFLKNKDYKIQYFSNLSKIDDSDLLQKIQEGHYIGIGIPVPKIPICTQQNLENTYIVYELLANRTCIQFGLTTGNITNHQVKAEFDLCNKLDEFLKDQEYIKEPNDAYWYFIYSGKRDWFTPEQRAKWFDELYDYLSKE
ncbi:MAG: PD-(D/E)XK nuclease family protein [Brevinema sp.]